MSEKYEPQLENKLDKSSEKKEFSDLQQRFLDTMKFVGKTGKEKKESAKAKETLKEEFMNEYPDDIEGIEIIFGIKRFFSISSRLTQDREEMDRSKKLDKASRMEILRELTRYQFLLTHYVITISDTPDGKKDLEDFWKLTKKVAEDSELSEQFNAIKKGILGQVASYKILQKLGEKEAFSPRLPHPELDAFYSVDLLTNENVAVQVKSGSAKEPVLLGIEEIENIGIPATIFDRDGKKIFINERHSEALNRFKFNLERLSSETNEDYKGYEFIIPSKMIDQNDGTPNEYVLKYFEKELLQRLNRQNRGLKQAA